MAGPTIKHSPPSFNINTVKGWNTRLLYNFYGAPSAIFDYYVTGGNYAINIFDVIQTWEANNTQLGSKGQFVFPAKYFKTGKSVRVRGRLLINGGTSSIFNIRASIDNSVNGLTPVAAQNNFNDHTFAAGNSQTDVPIDFEIIYTSLETTDLVLFMQANGYYQYNTNEYNTAGTNLTNAYVPIWNSTQYISVELTSLTGTNELYISFDNSTVTKIILSYLTVEELS